MCRNIRKSREKGARRADKYACGTQSPARICVSVERKRGGTFVIKLLYRRYSNEMTSNDRVRPAIVARTSFSLTSALNIVVFTCKYPTQIHVRKTFNYIILSNFIIPRFYIAKCSQSKEYNYEETNYWENICCTSTKISIWIKWKYVSTKQQSIYKKFLILLLLINK